MTNPLPTWLRRMKIWRVALVDRPANPDASVVFYKAKGGPEKSPSGQGIDQTPEPGEQSDAKTGPVGDEDDVQKEQVCKVCGGNHSTAMHDQVTKDGPGLSDVHTPAGDIHKGAGMDTQADREQLATLKKQLEVEKQDKEALQARLEKVEGQQRQERYIAKVKRFAYVPTLLPDDFATIFAKIDAALSEPERERFDKMMTATNAALRQSALFAEYGATGHQGTGSEPAAKIDALVKAEREKDGKLTHGQAYAKVLQQNPELYNEYLIAKQDKAAGRS